MNTIKKPPIEYSNYQNFLDSIHFNDMEIFFTGLESFSVFISECRLSLNKENLFIILHDRKFIFNNIESANIVYFTLLNIINKFYDLFSSKLKIKEETIFFRDINKCVNKNDLIIFYLRDGEIVNSCIKYKLDIVNNFNVIINRINYIKKGNICIEEIENHFKFILEAMKEISKILNNR